MSYVNNLRMFVRVYDLSSMSAAARDQRTSPAVASARISELEKHLGVRLFNRNTRRIRLTPEGEAFAEKARAALRALDDAVADLTVLRDDHDQNLTGAQRDQLQPVQEAIV